MDVVLLNIPKKLDVDTRSPFAFLASANICTPPICADAPPPTFSRDDMAKACSSVWSEAGGVSAAYLKRAVRVLTNGDVEAPANSRVLLRAAVTFCHIVCDKCGRGCMAIVSADIVRGVVDALLYDPNGKIDEEDLGTLSRSVSSWLRQLFGDGWGVRTEVYVDRMAPPESNAPGLWLLLLVIAKPYMPHVSSAEFQNELRTECAAKCISMSDLLSTASCRIRQIKRQ